MVYDRLPIRVTWLVFLLWMATIASQAQTYVQFSIQTPLPDIFESFRCDESAPDLRYELLSRAPRRVPLPILNANCIAQFSSRPRPQETGRRFGWEPGQRPENLCRVDRVWVEVPSPSGGKPMFCGTICSFGQAVRACTR